MLRALLWDVDGTLAETERDGHRVAFNMAFDEFGLPWRWDEVQYGRLLAVTGGLERLLHDMASRPDAPADHEALARELHRLKTRHYADIVRRGAITLRHGVRELIADCAAAGLRQVITTTSSRQNVEELLSASGLGGFGFLLCADSAPRKKPGPQVFQMVLARLALPDLRGAGGRGFARRLGCLRCRWHARGAGTKRLFRRRGRGRRACCRARPAHDGRLAAGGRARPAHRSELLLEVVRGKRLRFKGTIEG